MRINSSFHDYYDVAMAEGQDQSLVYQRHKKIVDVVENWPFCSASHIGRNYTIDVSLNIHTVGFCGKKYPVFELTSFKSNKSKFCYSLSDVDKFIETNFSSKEVQDYYSNRRITQTWDCNLQQTWDCNLQHSYFKRFFEQVEQSRLERAGIIDKHFENLCPVFVATYQPVQQQYKIVKYGTITYHDCLGDFEFFRIFQPVQAFQEINMWLSSQAAPIKPIPQISDEIMLEVKGFDKKLSFRKDKTSNKRRK